MNKPKKLAIEVVIATAVFVVVCATGFGMTANNPDAFFKWQGMASLYALYLIVAVGRYAQQRWRNHRKAARPDGKQVQA